LFVFEGKQLLQIIGQADSRKGNSTTVTGGLRVGGNQGGETHTESKVGRERRRFKNSLKRHKTEDKKQKARRRRKQEKWTRGVVTPGRKSKKKVKNHKQKTLSR